MALEAVLNDWRRVGDSHDVQNSLPGDVHKQDEYTFAIDRTGRGENASQITLAEGVHTRMLGRMSTNAPSNDNRGHDS